MIKVNSTAHPATRIEIHRIDLVGMPKVYRADIWKNFYAKSGVFTYKDLEFLRDEITKMLGEDGCTGT